MMLRARARASASEGRTHLHQQSRGPQTKHLRVTVCHKCVSKLIYSLERSYSDARMGSLMVSGKNGHKKPQRPRARALESPLMLLSALLV